MKLIVASLVVVTCVVVGLDVFAGPFFSLAARKLPTAVQGRRIIGGVEGPVKSTDEQTRIVRIASGFLGLSSLPVRVTPETTIAVDGKLGWWGDLSRGLLVRVTYEVTPDERLVASHVDVLTQVSPVAASPSTASGNAEQRPPSREIPVATEASASPRVHEPAGVTRPSAVTPERPAAAPAQERRPRSASAPTTSTRAPVAVDGSPSRSPAIGPAPERRPPPPERSQSEDGGAAVEWLLKESSAGR